MTVQERSTRERQPAALKRIDQQWRAMPGEIGEAIGDLIAEPYLRLSYPTVAAFAAAFDVVPGTTGYDEEWARQIARARGAMLGAYRAESRVYALYARNPAGEPVALATMMTVRGTRETMVAASPGDAASAIPTLQVIDFAFGPGTGIAVTATPERRVAEFGRICIRQPSELLGLVADGTLSLAQAAYVEERGFDEMFSQSFWRDQGLPEPPLAYFGTMKPWMADGMARRGLDLRPLFLHDGAEPTEEILRSGRLSAAYFGQWRAELSRHVPAAIMARGIRAAVRYLAQERFTDWTQLPIALPYLIVNNARTREAMANLALACGFAVGTGNEQEREG